MKHLVLISTSYPDKEPGSEAAGAFVADFAMELSHHARITVLAPARHSSTESTGNLTIQRFAVPRLPLSLLHPGNPLHWLAIAKTLRAGRLALGTLATQTSIDHILALWALPSGFWAQRVGARHGIPYSCWALGSDIWSLGRIPVVRSLLRHVLRKSHHCYADGYQLKNDVEVIAGRPCEFLPSMRRLISLKQTTPRQSPPYRLAFLGRFHPNKGVDLLLDALTLLNDEAWHDIACIRIAGGGPLQGQVENRVGILRQRGRPVELEGYKDRHAAIELLDWCDFVLIPSRIESIPVIFSDAMQMEKPVIAMPVGDLPQLINQHDVGLVCRNVTATAYAELLTPLSLTALAGKRSHCRSVAEDFNLTCAATRLLSELALIDV